MKATFPIITCDFEDGCDQWTLDWYSALASNWRELMEPGWSYNPYKPNTDQLCPRHAADARRQGEGPFCEETWPRPGGSMLICQRGPRHADEDRPHKDPSGLLWSDEERAAGRLR